jgi:hypothetical protein
MNMLADIAGQSEDPGAILELENPIQRILSRMLFGKCDFIV